MKTLLLYSALLLISIPESLKAGLQDSIKLTNYQIVDAVSGEPVQLAHVMNSTQQWGTISDRLGYFAMSTRIGDTILISAIGYFDHWVYCWGQFQSDSLFYRLQMSPRIYELKEVKISRFTTYDNFLKEVIRLKLPKSKEEEQLERIVNYFDQSIRKLNLINLPGSASGFAFGKDWYMKQYEKLDEKLLNEKRQRNLDRKYNAGIVAVLSGLAGNEVHYFMDFCDLQEEYLLGASDYEIRVKILEKLELYRQNRDKQAAKGKQK